MFFYFFFPLSLCLYLWCYLQRTSALSPCPLWSRDVFAPRAHERPLRSASAAQGDRDAPHETDDCTVHRRGSLRGFDPTVWLGVTIPPSVARFSH